jgi:hypothetical protein
MVGNETWFWGVSFQLTGRKSYGHAPTLNDAKAAFGAEYVAWKKSRLMRLSQVNAAVLCSASDKAHGVNAKQHPRGDEMTDVFAYAVTGNDLFGVVDLTTGVFTESSPGRCSSPLRAADER